MNSEILFTLEEGMHYMIITIAQNITLNTCTTVAINNQYTVPTESIFIYFKYCSYSKSKLLELTQPKYKKNIYTTNKKLPVYIYTQCIFPLKFALEIFAVQLT